MSTLAVRRTVEDIRREHERHWRSVDQHWQDIAVLLDEIAGLQATIKDWEDWDAEDQGEFASADEEQTA